MQLIGPVFIAPGACPGGVVVHVYAPDGRFILARSLTSEGEAETTAAGDALAAVAVSPEQLVMVAYDGDSGERMPLAEIMGATHLDYGGGPR